MKKITVVAAVAVALLASACTASFEEATSNPGELSKDDPKVPPRDPGGATDDCTTEVLDAVQCTGVDELHAKATAVCGSGRVLGIFEAPENCGKGLATIAKFQCCTVPPPSDPCFGLVVGDPKTCYDDGELETMGQTACGAQKAKMTLIAPDNACDGDSIKTSHTAKVECCR